MHNSIPMNRLFLVLPLFLSACIDPEDPAHDEQQSATDEDLSDPDGDGDDLSRSLRWSEAGEVPTVATQFAVSGGNTFVLGEDGFFEHDGSDWSALDDAVGSVDQVVAVDGAVAVTTTDGLLLRADGETGFSQVTEVGDGWVFLVSGDAGLFSSSSIDDQAYQVWPEVQSVGSAFDVLFSSCSNLVSDGQLEIFSMDMGEWLEIPLPDPDASIFEFAATETHRWIFGAGSMWRGSADGTSWTEEIETPGVFFHTDVRQHGDAIITSVNSDIAWTIDGGDEWVVLETPYGYSQWETSEGYLYYLQEAHSMYPETDDSVLRRVSLADGPDSDEIYLSLPPATLYTPRITEAGEVLVTSERGTSLLGEDDREDTYGVFGSWLLDAVLVEDENTWVEDATEVWFAVGEGWAGAPMMQTVGGAGGVYWATPGWPAAFDALSLTYTQGSIMACTGSAAGEHDAGAGVWGLDLSDPNWTSNGWSEVGTGFPVDGEGLASCSHLFDVDDQLIASTSLGAVRLTTDGVWESVEGLDDVTAVVVNEAGHWALTPDGLSFSEEGQRFELVDDSVVGAQRLFAVDDLLVVLHEGSLLLGGPGDWDASQWDEDQDIRDLNVRDEVFLAITDRGTAWTASLD